jgi:hypothetical protein
MGFLACNNRYEYNNHQHAMHAIKNTELTVKGMNESNRIIKESRLRILNEERKLKNEISPIFAIRD